MHINKHTFHSSYISRYTLSYFLKILFCLLSRLLLLLQCIVVVSITVTATKNISFCCFLNIAVFHRASSNTIQYLPVHCCFKYITILPVHTRSHIHSHTHMNTSLLL